MGLFVCTREQSFSAQFVLLCLKRPLIAIKFVLDESLDSNQLVITETTRRFGGINLRYSFEGLSDSVLVIESDEPYEYVSDCQIMQGPRPAAETVNYLRVPLESDERIMQFRDPIQSLRIAFGPAEYGYAII